MLMETQLDVKIMQPSSYIHGLHFVIEQKAATFETLKQIGTSFCSLKI